MFEALSDKLSGVFDRLRGRGGCPRRTSTRRCARCASRCSRPTWRCRWCASSSPRCASGRSGAEVLIRSVTPRPAGRQDRLRRAGRNAGRGRGGAAQPERARRRSPILMVGLQGSGKTTTSGKLALRLRAERKTVLLASLDTRRPAARCSWRSWPSRRACASLPIVAGPDAGRDRAPRHGDRRGARATTSSSSTPPAGCRSTRR